MEDRIEKLEQIVEQQTHILEKYSKILNKVVYKMTELDTDIKELTNK